MAMDLFLVVVAFSIANIVAAINSTTAACAAIDNALPGVLAYPLRDLIRFEAELHSYWSQADADYVPACISFPLDAAQTSTIVRVLNNYTDVQFAVKSGGHNTNRGWSSVNGGILIAFSSNAATNISGDGLTADIGPGSRWGNVMTALEPYGKAVVGGRIGDVGVGGYVLGGGLSFLSAEYGLACDTVVNFETVLADGSIVNANATSHPDLFFALKGGGNQFGVVTKITMRTIPIGQIWGGIRIYAGSDEVASTFVNATHSFITNYTDNKAAVIVTTERTDILNLWVIFFFYNGPSPPNGTFDAFETFTPISDTVRTQSFSSFLNANDAVNLEGLRYLIRGTTLPTLPGADGIDLLNYQYTSWQSQAVADTLTSPDFIYSMAFQPMPVAIANASATAGGNALGLDPRAGDHVWMEYDISWLTALGDSNAHSQAMDITTTIDAYARSHYAGIRPTHYGGLTDDADIAGDTGITYQEYNPIFMNDAMYDQRPLQSYPLDNYNALLSAKRRYDPNGFFTSRTNGFKF